MPYRLYGCRRSGSLAVELVLAEIGLDYETHNIDLDAGAQRNAEFERVNPQRKIPALVTPDGEILTESAAILLTLEELYPESQLMPARGSIERAMAIRMLMFIATEIYPLIEINDYPERFSPTPESANKVREKARELWRKRWLIVEEASNGDPYFLKSGFCLLDIYIAVVSRWAQQEEWRSKNLPKVERITKAVSSRPQSAPVWNKHNPNDVPTRFQ